MNEDLTLLLVRPGTHWRVVDRAISEKDHPPVIVFPGWELLTEAVA